ncbi:hypothetical protein [Nitrosococcus oceani]|uniref:hypothetical protein n=1 Tax=Nitrosococcus oceani TaxID=1229 RepID=UPI0004E8E3FA|nr:hypothetical protein [Nitrosococcus oceani]KFI22598.1 membrane protein [Nitrosococcus oceani]
MSNLPEKNESLWLLIVSPTIWTVHFLLCYLTSAIWCAKVAGRYGSLDNARLAIAVYTALALLGIGVTGWHAFRRHRYGTATAPHDFDTPEDRHRFLGFAALLLSGLSGISVVYVALVAVFMGTCH